MIHDRKRLLRRLFVAPAAVLAAALAAAAGQAADKLELPPGPNRDLVYGACRTCHDLQYVTESAGITRDDWADLIDSMRQYGLRIPPARRAKILDYLGTYLGPNPPKKSTTEVASTPTEPLSGTQLFTEQCSGCHQPNGMGQPGMFPPLAGNRDLMRDRLFPVYVVLYGLKGKISVRGRKYNGEMPPFDHLTDAEVATLIEHIRSAWNNAALRPEGLKPLDAATVKQARAKSMSPADVHAYRARLQ